MARALHQTELAEKKLKPLEARLKLLDEKYAGFSKATSRKILVQVSGKYHINVFDDGDNATEHILEAGDTLRMGNGQYHIHSNPFNETSYTLFKAEGDITEIMKVLRSNFIRLGERDNE